MAAILTYAYVADILERRAPHRAGHLALVRLLQERGDCLLAGAVGDPVHGATLVFASAEIAERFVADDPYAAAGLVTEHRIEPIAVVEPEPPGPGAVEAT
jgi:uncharacterized protein YciI